MDWSKDMESFTLNNDDKYYEFFERVAILLENNPGMSEQEAKEQAKQELRERREGRDARKGV